MTRNRFFMIMLLTLTFLAGWMLGSRSGVSAAAAGPRMELVHGVGLTVQYGDQNRIHLYDSNLNCVDALTVTAPGAPATHESCKQSCGP